MREPASVKQARRGVRKQEPDDPPKFSARRSDTFFDPCGTTKEMPVVCKSDERRVLDPITRPLALSDTHGEGQREDGRRNDAVSRWPLIPARLRRASIRRRLGKIPSVSRGTGCSCIQSDRHPGGETLGGIALESGPLRQPKRLVVNWLKGRDEIVSVRG